MSALWRSCVSHKAGWLIDWLHEGPAHSGLDAHDCVCMRAGPVKMVVLADMIELCHSIPAPGAVDADIGVGRHTRAGSSTRAHDAVVPELDVHDLRGGVLHVELGCAAQMESHRLNQKQALRAQGHQRQRQASAPMVLSEGWTRSDTVREVIACLIDCLIGSPERARSRLCDLFGRCIHLPTSWASPRPNALAPARPQSIDQPMIESIHDLHACTLPMPIAEAMWASQPATLRLGPCSSTCNW